MGTYSWLSKDPDEVLDYTHNFAPLLEEGELVSSHDAMVDEGDIEIDDFSFDDGIMTVWLSGGTAGFKNRLTLRINTNAGRTYDEGIKINIKGH